MNNDENNTMKKSIKIISVFIVVIGALVFFQIFSDNENYLNQIANSIFGSYSASGGLKGLKYTGASNPGAGGSGCVTGSGCNPGDNGQGGGGISGAISVAQGGNFNNGYSHGGNGGANGVGGYDGESGRVEIYYQ